MLTRTSSLCKYIVLVLWDHRWYAVENRVPLMHKVVSVVWHLSLPLMNSFNKTEAAFCPCMLWFLFLRALGAPTTGSASALVDRSRWMFNI